MPDAQIHLHREARDWAERFRRFRILLDGARVGEIRRGQTITLAAEPGRHTLQVAIDWGRSAALEIELGPDAQLTMRCWTNATPWTALYWITFGRTRYLGLEVA